MQRQFINSCFCSICFFASNSSQFFNFLAISCMIFLEERTSQFQFSIQAEFISLSLICPIDLLDVPEIIEIPTPDRSLQKRCQNFSFPNSSPQLLPQLHTFFPEPFSLVGRPSQLSVQGFGGDFLCLSTNAQRLDLDLFSLLTEQKSVVATDSMSNSAPVSWRPERLDT